MPHLLLIAVLAFALGAALAWAMLSLPVPAIVLGALVEEQLAASGVTHPVTAVLLNFRGYDTLLEIGVLLLAVLGMLSLRLAAADTDSVRRPAPEPVLRALVYALVPLMVLAAGYLLWSGAHQPGGAFQAGAVLAAAGVLLRLAGILPALHPPRAALRAGLLLGFALFLAVGAAAAGLGTALLAYPRAYAGVLITLIETALTVSIGLILVSLFVGAPSPQEARPERRAGHRQETA